MIEEVKSSGIVTVVYVFRIELVTYTTIAVCDLTMEQQDHLIKMLRFHCCQLIQLKCLQWFI